MLVRVVFETFLPLQRAFDVDGRYLRFLRQSVSEYGYILPMEEIKAAEELVHRQHRNRGAADDLFGHASE